MVTPVLECEEPLRANSSLVALDESSGTVELAEFCLEGVSRYILKWPRQESGEGSKIGPFIWTVRQALSEDASFVIGWRHGVPDDLRVRHRLLVNRLRRLGWELDFKKAVGVATKAVVDEETSQSIEELQHTARVGWFLAFGKWASPETLQKTPFLATVQSFCWTHRLQPSKEFLKGLREVSGAIVYPVADGVRSYRVVVVVSEALGGRMSELLLGAIAGDDAKE